jgi:hypothetical protein
MSCISMLDPSLEVESALVPGLYGVTFEMNIHKKCQL